MGLSGRAISSNAQGPESDPQHREAVVTWPVGSTAGEAKAEGSTLFKKKTNKTPRY